MVRLSVISRLRGRLQIQQNSEIKSTDQPERPLRPQVALAVQHFMVTIASGMSIGHSAVLLPQLRKKDSDLIIDEETGSWIASVYMFVSPFGCLAGGILLEKIGRRTGVLVGELVFMLGWLLIAAAQSSLMLICGRVVDGIGTGIMASSAAILFDEMAHPRLRGTILCLASSLMSCGALIMSTLGTFLHWRIAAALAIVPGLFHVPILVFLIRETPTFLIKKNRLKDAEKSLYWLWGPQDAKVRQEYDDLLTRFSAQEEDPKYTESNHNIASKISAFMRYLSQYIKPYILKPFLIIHIFNLLQMPGGMGMLTLYTVDILNNIQGDDQVLDGNTGTIIFSAMKFVFLLISACLLYHIGRRTIALISGVGSSIPTLILSIILYLEFINTLPVISTNTENWIKFSLILIYVSMNALGFYCLSYTMIGEVLPAKVRGFLFGYIFGMNYLVDGGFAKAYPFFIRAIGLHGLFLMFGVFCTLCTVFVYLLLPETLNKTLPEIEDYFRQSNVMWITRNRKPNVNIESERV